MAPILKSLSGHSTGAGFHGKLRLANDNRPFAA
jgi:hypothetical protein